MSDPSNPVNFLCIRCEEWEWFCQCKEGPMSVSDLDQLEERLQKVLAELEETFEKLNPELN